jgi:periplasmic protein CpxP/Spy
MKKSIATLAVLTLSATLAVAAPQGGKGEFHGKGKRGGHGEMAERLAEKLNLTDAQKAQARQLHEQFRAQNEPLFNAFKQTRNDLRAARQANDTARVDALEATLKTQKEQLKAARRAQHERFLSILTADQKAKLEAMKAERGERRGGRGRGNRQ